MKNVILATIGLAVFATPLAAENPHQRYPIGDRHIFDGHRLSPPEQAQAAPERFLVTPSTQSFGLAPPSPRTGFGSSTGGPWQNQDLRDRYGRISR